MTPREERVRTIAIMSAILAVKEPANFGNPKTYATFVARAVLLLSEANKAVDPTGEIASSLYEDARL